ncbi:MAG: DivIVA domain-containing protein [Acidimicrobiales bacterium]
MDSGQNPQQPILETLRTVEFRLGLKGYNVDEVDEYLEKAAVEAERLAEQLRQTNERLRQAGERIAQLEGQGPAPAPTATVPVPAAPPAPVVPDDSLQQTLLLAQRFVEQTKRESEAEATRVVSEAESRARSLVSRAEEDARQLVTESQQRLRDEVARLEGLRAQLATDVENMARHLESERNRLRTMLSEVLKWIEDNVQPAESLMAMRPRAVESGRAPAAGRLGTGEPELEGEEEASVDGDDNVAQVLDLRGPGAGPDARG